MEIVQDRCINCRLCVPVCPVGAFRTSGPAGGKGRIWVDQATCVECDICYRSGVCPVDALAMPELEWPRLLRRVFSDPLVDHAGTGVPGRGTEEMKTNDVTHRYTRESYGMAVELGRPGVSASFRDVEVITRALAPLGVHFEEENPVTSLLADPATGELDARVLDERVLSAIVEFSLPPARLDVVFDALEAAFPHLATVCSVSLIVPVGEVGWPPAEALAEARRRGWVVRPNGKNNLGLGRRVLG